MINIKNGETTVIVIDSIMGSGKSNLAIKYIQKSQLPVMYVTPYLDEVDRFVKSIDNMYEPKGEIKSIGLKMLINKGCHIATTHSLFSIMKEDILKKLKEKKYVLILDEVIEAYQTYPMTKQDYKLLKDKEYIFVDNNLRVYANDDEETKYIRQELFTSGVFNDFFQCIDNNMVYEYLNTPIVEYPINIFKAFNNIMVLTYMFRGSTLKPYFEINNIDYNVVNLDGNSDIIYTGEKFKDLIHIHSPKNSQDFNAYELSATWYKKHCAYRGKELAKHTRSFFNYVSKAKQDSCLYTVYKENIKDVYIKGYVNSYVPMNLRATNKYSNKMYGAYLVNRFLNPIVKKFIQHKKGVINEKVYALSEMLQWIWRLRIRNNQDIWLYIPSKRMRGLLQEWLGDRKKSKKLYS